MLNYRRGVVGPLQPLVTPVHLPLHDPGAEHPTERQLPAANRATFTLARQGLSELSKINFLIVIGHTAPGQTDV